MSFDFTSMKCGFAPQYVIAFTDPIKVRLGTNTSSFSFISKANKDNLKASVPLLTAIVYFELTKFDIFFFKVFSIHSCS